MLFSPLTCKTPLTGFESIRFCVSQYEDKERLLLKNLCFILGAKFTERLTKKVTHLICKFTSGPKYEAACTWGIQSITSDWINECIKQVYRFQFKCNFMLFMKSCSILTSIALCYDADLEL